MQESIDYDEPDDYEYYMMLDQLRAAGPGYNHTTIPAKPEPIADDNDEW